VIFLIETASRGPAG